MKLGNGEKELVENFYRKGDGTGCYYFELNDLKDLFVNDYDSANNDKLDLLELDYIQRVYRNRGDGTTRRRVWIQGRFRKPTLNEKIDISPVDKCVSTDQVKDFLDCSATRWNEHYRYRSKTLSSSYSLPSNLFQMFPNEFLPWMSWQSSKRKGGMRQHNFQLLREMPTSSSYVKVIDVGCGLGNETLLNLLDWQTVYCKEIQRQHQEWEECHVLSLSEPPILNVSFIDVSNEAIHRLREDPRYKRVASFNKNKSATTVTSHVFNLTSTQSIFDLQSIDELQRI